MGFIYLMYNKITTKIYIGQTTERIEDRIRKHFSNEHNIELAIDYEKYGKDSFEIYKLAECDNSKLNELERYYVKLYDSFSNGYNSTPGGGATNRVNIYNEELVLDLYKQGESLNSIQEKTGYRWHTIRLILDTRMNDNIEQSHAVNSVNRRKSTKTPIVMLDIAGSKVEKVFESKVDAYKYICKEQQKCIDKQNFYTRVGIACTSDRICYKHRWRFEDSDIRYDEHSLNKGSLLDNIDTLEKVSIKTFHKSAKPDIQTLQHLISKYSYEEIGRQYGVSGKAVRKWCDSYNISRVKSKKPSKAELEDLIENYTLNQIADIFGVTPGTVSWWKRDLGIINNNLKIVCIETGAEFTKYKDAGAYMKTLYPYTMGDKYVGFEIKKAIECNCKLHGYTWVLI